MDVQFATPEDDDPFVGADVDRVEFLPKLKNANIDIVRIKRSGARIPTPERVTNGDRYDAMIDFIRKSNADPFTALVMWMVADGVLPTLAPSPSPLQIKVL